VYERRRARILLAVLTLAALAFVTIDARAGDDNPVDRVRDGAHTVFGPLQDGLATALRPVTAAVDGEAVRVLDLAQAVGGYLDGSYRVDIVDVETIDDVHVFHLSQGPGGVETRVWRQGPHTIFLSGPIGIGLEEIAAATIALNR
jgi:hypothetical protein